MKVCQFNYWLIRNKTPFYTKNAVKNTLCLFKISFCTFSVQSLDKINVILVQICLWDLSLSAISASAAIDFVETCLGLFLGFSFMTLWDGATKMVMLIKFSISKMRFWKIEDYKKVEEWILHTEITWWKYFWMIWTHGHNIDYLFILWNTPQKNSQNVDFFYVCQIPGPYIIRAFEA